MSHPNDQQLQLYMDHELGPSERRQVEGHLNLCPECRARLATWQSLSMALRATEPAREAMRPAGEFWTRLAGRLPRQQRVTWPLVDYLPAVLLGAVGLALHTLISLAFWVYGFAGSGPASSLGRTVADGLGMLLSLPVLEDTLYAWLGWSSSEVSGQVVQSWNLLTTSGQGMVLFAGLLAMLILLLAVVVALYLTWAMCWSTPDRREQEGGF